MKTRLAFVSQWYPPEPAAIPQAIAHAMQDQGMEVEVFTGIPNYPNGVVAPGYSARKRTTEILDGVRVHRSPLYPSHDSSAAKRLLNYMSWAVSSALFAQRRLRQADACLVYSSPATAALPAMAAKALWRTPYVLLIQDVWPDSVFASGFLKGRMSKLIYRAIDVFVRRTYAWAAHIVVISPGMADLLIERGVPPEKVSLVYNWLPDSETTPPASGARTTLHKALCLSIETRVFLYAGNHGHAQALEALVDAFDRPGTEGGHLVLLGDGVTKSDLQSRARDAPRVHFLPPVPRAEATRLTRTADVHVVSLADEPLFSVTMPSKVQSGLAAGLPMLVVAPGDAASVVVENGAGVSATPGDVDAVVRAIEALMGMTRAELSLMGERGARVYVDSMARDVGAPRLAAVLEQVGHEGARHRGVLDLVPERKRT